MRNGDNEQTTQWRFTEQMGADDATAQISLPPSDETTVMAAPVTERVYGSPAGHAPAAPEPAGPAPDRSTPDVAAPARPVAEVTPEGAAPAAPGPAAGTDRGRTTIASEVIERVVDRLVQLAVADADGVVGLHPGVDRFFGESDAEVADAADPESAGEQSVAVKLEDRQAEINIAIEVEFGHPVHEAVEQVRRSVIESAERLLGLTVTEVNVAVTGVTFPPAE